MKLSPALVFSLLLAVALTLSTCLLPRALAWTEGRRSDHLMQVLLGDGRQILANQMFTEADVYFHNGYYPSIFDQAHAPTNAQHMTPEAVAPPGDQPDVPADARHAEQEHEQAMSFLGEPRDGLERFGRNFAITSHTHASGGKEREILPWLRLAADLDPHRIETYTVAAYWLRHDLGQPTEAEQFLREGLNANPGSYELLFDLGQLYYENDHDPARARNLWAAALRRWAQSESKKPEPDLPALGKTTVRLARLEEADGHYARAIELLEIALAHHASPHPEALHAQINALRAKIGGK